MQLLQLNNLEAHAGEAARFMKLFANEQRLMILCQLAGSGEMAVNALAGAVGLSQSALSQHLARLRTDGLVSFRREARTLYYSVADQRALRLLRALRHEFCP